MDGSHSNDEGIDIGVCTTVRIEQEDAIRILLKASSVNASTYRSSLVRFSTSMDEAVTPPSFEPLRTSHAPTASTSRKAPASGFVMESIVVDLNVMNPIACV